METALCAPGRLGLAESDVSAILDCTHLGPNATVLDLGCGPGAHAVAFAKRGHRVTGVDSSRRLLDRARDAARREGVAVEWVEADMREFERPATFDLVCSLYASFGYFDDAQNRTVLEKVRASLMPGAVLVLDVMGREATARHWQERRWHEIGGVLYLERCTASDDWSCMVSDWIVVRDGARAEFRVKQRLYSGTELRALLSSVGFGSVQLGADLGVTTPYDESARRLVAVARAMPGP